MYMCVYYNLNPFKECYPTVNITPKMVHLPEQIRRLAAVHNTLYLIFPWPYNRFGPLIRYWCMRMEAKNAYVKRATNRGNFKNVTLSFSQRHQRLLALSLSDPNIMSLNYTLGPARYDDKQTNYWLLVLLSLCNSESKPS